MREVAWRSVQAHFDELIPSLESWTASFLPFIARRFCDPRRAAEVQAFFEERVAKLPSARQNLDQTVEEIRLCAAYKAAQEASAIAFFERLPEQQLPVSQIPQRH